jgi:predicted DNA-binding transcriptional regulator AlpA
MTNHITSKPNVTRGPAERLLTRRLLREMVPVSDMTIWRWERDDCFPRHLTVHRRNYWLESEVNAWLSSQHRAKPASRKGGC